MGNIVWLLRRSRWVHRAGPRTESCDGLRGRYAGAFRQCDDVGLLNHAVTAPNGRSLSRTRVRRRIGIHGADYVPVELLRRNADRPCGTGAERGYADWVVDAGARAAVGVGGGEVEGECCPRGGRMLTLRVFVSGHPLHVFRISESGGKTGNLASKASLNAASA